MAADNLSQEEHVNILNEESIRQLDHDDLIQYALKITNAASQVLQLMDTITKMKEDQEIAARERDTLKEDLEKVMSELAISKNTTTLLKSELVSFEDRMVKQEKDTLNNGQYLRRRQLEIVNVPANDLKLEVPQLKKKMADFLSVTGVKVVWNDIDKCHLMKNNKTVIMELKVREKRDSILRARKELKDKTAKLKEIKYDKTIISESLCPEYSRLFYVCRQAKRDKIIAETWFFNGRLFVKKTIDGERVLVSHLYDLYDLLGQDYVLGKIN